MKKIIAIFLVTLMVATCTGCGASLEGTFVNSESKHTFVFENDGSCSYTEGSTTYKGIWSSEDDSYKIELEGLACTLYGRVSNDTIMVTSDSGFFWSNESFTKQ